MGHIISFKQEKKNHQKWGQKNDFHGSQMQMDFKGLVPSSKTIYGLKHSIQKLLFMVTHGLCADIKGENQRYAKLIQLVY